MDNFYNTDAACGSRNFKHKSIINGPLQEQALPSTSKKVRLSIGPQLPNTLNFRQAVPSDITTLMTVAPAGMRLAEATSGASGDTEVVLRIQGALCYAQLPPIRRNMTLPDNGDIRFMKQTVRLTGLGSTEFTDAIQDIANIVIFMGESLEHADIETWKPERFRNWQAIELTNRYFTHQNNKGDMIAVPIAANVDPEGVLALLAGDKWVHTEDNEVSYFCEEVGAGGKQKYTVTNPSAFKVGDLVEAQFSALAPYEGRASYQNTDRDNLSLTANQRNKTLGALVKTMRLIPVEEERYYQYNPRFDILDHASFKFPWAEAAWPEHLAALGPVEHFIIVTPMPVAWPPTPAEERITIKRWTAALSESKSKLCAISVLFRDDQEPFLSAGYARGSHRYIFMLEAEEPEPYFQGVDLARVEAYGGIISDNELRWVKMGERWSSVELESFAMFEARSARQSNTDRHAIWERPMTHQGMVKWMVRALGSPPYRDIGQQESANPAPHPSANLITSTTCSNVNIFYPFLRHNCVTQYFIRASARRMLTRNNILVWPYMHCRKTVRTGLQPSCLQHQQTSIALCPRSREVQKYGGQNWGCADIDIYVNLAHVIETGRHMVKVERYRVMELDDNDAMVALDESYSIHHIASIAKDALHHVNQTHYQQMSIHFVCNLERISHSGEVLRAQMIVTSDSVFHAIMNFHSTCIMNIITHNRAVSFYPLATFEFRTNEQMSTPGASARSMASADEAIAKYNERDFRVAGQREVNECRVLFQYGMDRKVGDHWCWTIPFNMDGITPRKWVESSRQNFEPADGQQVTAGSQQPQDPIFANEWRMSGDRVHFAPKYCLLWLPVFKYNYAVADGVKALRARRFNDDIMEVRKGGACKTQKWFDDDIATVLNGQVHVWLDGNHVGKDEHKIGHERDDTASDD
ncbi:hypothetical protein HWV62_21072 [Athelia sp. TMB]|nr:hypothetical protein HWV62_21072 [Athelia sp. TMB]